jgi:hypothetical protein
VDTLHRILHSHAGNACEDRFSGVRLMTRSIILAPVPEILSSLDHLGGGRVDPVFEEEAQHFPRGVRSSPIGERAGWAAPRPCVARSMDLPVLKYCAAAWVGMDRASIGMSSGDATAMHRLSQIRGSHRPRDDVISVARIHGGVAIAVKHDGRERAAFANERNVARVQRIPKVTSPHGDER